MAVLDIIRMGHPRLFDQAKPIVDFDDLGNIIDDLRDSKNHYHGAGLSGPQLGIFKQIFIMGFGHNPRYPEQPPIPETIFINPSFEPISPEMDDYWEACLSVPGMRGLVPRYTHIYYKGFNQHAEPFEGEAKGFVARVIQHEIDHLNGILFPMRVENKTKFGYEKEIYASIGRS